MNTAQLLAQFRKVRVFTAGNATLATIKNSPLICDGLSVQEFAAGFIAPLRSDVTEEQSSRMERALLSRLEARFGRSDVIVLHDKAHDEATSSFTPFVREALPNLIGRYRGKTIWVCSLRPELFQDTILEISPRTARAVSLRLPEAPDLRQLYTLCNARLLLVSGGAQELVVMQSNREDRVPLRGPWSENAAAAFTLAAACAFHVSGSPLIAVRFGSIAAAVAAEDPKGGVFGPAIVAADASTDAGSSS